jgi:lactonase
MTSPKKDNPKNMHIITASQWLHVTDSPTCTLEGPAFDRDGNLYFVDVNGMGKVYKVIPSSKELSVMCNDRRTPFAAAKIHKDGRIFLCGFAGGNIVIISPDGTLLNEMQTVSGGRLCVPDDMIFDDGGNFYFTSYDSEVATGGLYRISADLADFELIMTLDHANGVSLSPDGRHLWASETLKRMIRRLDINACGKIIPESMCSYPIPEDEPGWPDSNQVDSAGNLYQAMFHGARLVVLDPQGKHVADVVLPEGDREGFGHTTNVAFQPGTDTGFITTSGEGGGRIYTFKGLSKGLPLFSHA